jgi:hypothetical protein
LTFVIIVFDASTDPRIDGLQAYGNCTTPAIEQFPKTLMTPEQRRHGGLLFHVFVAAYMFAGLSIVCDDYFVPSLEAISGGQQR